MKPEEFEEFLLNKNWKLAVEKTVHPVNQQLAEAQGGQPVVLRAYSKGNFSLELYPKEKRWSLYANTPRGYERVYGNLETKRNNMPSKEFTEELFILVGVDGVIKAAPSMKMAEQNRIQRQTQKRK